MKCSITDSNTQIVFDATAVTNVHASLQAESIIGTLSEVCLLPSGVKKSPSITLYEGPPDAPFSMVSKTGLPALLANGTFVLVTLTEQEEPLFYSLTGRLQDVCDAEACTIALSRGFALATDDARTACILKRICPSIKLLSTPDLIYHWHSHGEVSDKTVREAVTGIRTRACYSIKENHPRRDWWQYYNQNLYQNTQ